MAHLESEFLSIFVLVPDGFSICFQFLEISIAVSTSAIGCGHSRGARGGTSRVPLLNLHHGCRFVAAGSGVVVGQSQPGPSLWLVALLTIYIL